MSGTSDGTTGGHGAQRGEILRSAIEEAAGGRDSLDGFVVEMYGELRRMAHRRLRGERTGHTLSTTALVHESYLKLGRLDRLEWQGRSHFLAEAARAMRRVLVDHAVRRGARKRGGDHVRVDLRDGDAAADSDMTGLLALHDALDELAAHYPRHARVVECRFFAGMTVPEIAEALGVSPVTVKRDWQIARAWLNRALDGGAAADG